MAGNPPGPTGRRPARLDKDTTARTAAQPPATLGIRLVQPAHNQSISIKMFIALVEKEEKRYPLEQQKNTKLMITRLRKIFYGKDSWDKYLIEGARYVKRPYETKVVKKRRFTIPLDWSPDLDVVRNQYSVTNPATGNSPMIARNQEIRLANGSYIDIGHVFAGLDAINFPQMVDGPGKVNIDKNVDATTWVGDLGSVLAEVVFKTLTKKNGPVSIAEINAIIHEYASPQDMLGDIDAYVIKTRYDTGKTAQGLKVSEILRRYYLSDSPYVREHRYSVFAGQVGLKGWNGSVFENEKEWIQYYADQVNDAAALYVGANTEGIAKYPVALEIAGNKSAITLVTLFLKALKTRIRSEPNGSSNTSK